MPNIPKLHRVSRTWLVDGPLAPYIPAYIAHFRNERYAPSYLSHQLSALAHFAHWQSMCEIPVHVLDEDVVKFFVRHHLPNCSCTGATCKSVVQVRAALNVLIQLLRERGIIAAPALPSGHIPEELERYDAYLKDARGITPSTRRGVLRITRRLLDALFAQRPVVIGKLRPEDIRRFIADQLQLRNTTSNAVALTSAIRSYLRYRASCGDSVTPLLACISSPAHWEQATLPRSLSDDEVDRLIKSFAKRSPSPHRGYAVVRLALDLGLRSIEINRLTIDDIDWGLGIITLKRTKSRRQDVLPLPVSTGEALEAYVRHERPKTSNRALFVRHLPPFSQPLGVDGIRRVIRDAYRRSGIPHGRTHALRHTLARQMIDGGNSIKEIADVLRHRSLNTSRIYAKVNYDALYEVALPWPGSSS